MVLAGLAITGCAIGLGLYLLSRPVQYRPDEQSADITSSLARNLPPEAPQPRFTDVTRQANLAGFQTFIGQRTSQMPEDMGPGVAWGDFDNDGDDDLFLVSVGGPMNHSPSQWAPCELHENIGAGQFRKVAGFPETRLLGMAAAWGDFDEDGFLDIVLTGYDQLLLFRNENGSGRFTRDLRLPNPKGFWSGASWGDYNNDRHLDLYVCGYIQFIENESDIARGSVQQGAFVPFTLNPASYAGGTNLLFRSNGDGTFTEVSAALNVQNLAGRSLGALWHDLDDDGWLDLYVANDISDNVFFHNTGGTFEDLSHPALLADYRSAMGLTAGDYNRDGDDDLFITHWVAQENALYENLLADFTSKGGASATNAPTGMTNSPLAGHVNPTRSHIRFMDFADMKGVGQMALPYVGWGTEFVDFDSDGWLDLMVANGNTLEFDGPIPRKLKPQEPFLLWNHHGDAFHNLASLSPPWSEQHVSRGLAVSDYDGDGDMDVILSHLGEGVQLLRNDTPNGHWIKIRLRSRLQNGEPRGFGDGAKLIAQVGPAILRRTVSSVSYLSQSSRTVHFGLGEAKQIDRLEVRWLGGQTNVFEGLAADQTYDITEGNSVPRKIERTLARTEPVSAKGAVSPPPNRPRTAPSQTSETRPVQDKQRLLQFWTKQRAAMNAMKVEKDNARAVLLFREALALNPDHEDSLYYLGLCLASLGETAAALDALAELQRQNPQSHRAWQQWGVVKALFAREPSDLHAAEQALLRARAVNPEETGALLVLGEVALLRGDLALAEERFAAVSRTNHRAVGALFLRAYISWKQGRTADAQHWLEQTRVALGPEWKPKGTTSEGDVTQKQHVETTPLARFWEAWDGSTDSARTFAPLDRHLQSSIANPRGK